MLAETKDSFPTTTGLRRMSTGISLPLRRRAAKSRPTPIGRTRGLAMKDARWSGCWALKRFGISKLDRSTDQFVARIAEHLLGLCVDECDQTELVDEHQGVGRCVEQGSEAIFRLNSTSGVLRNW